MSPGSFFRARTRNIALVGNYLPRKCGIATFTTDLGEALSAEAEVVCWALVMNDIPEGYDYPPQVRLRDQPYFSPAGGYEP